MSILSGWKVYAAGALVLASAYAGHQVTAWQKDAKYNAMVATNAQVMQDYSDRASKAEAAQREEGERRQDEKDKVQNEARAQIAVAQADAVRAAGERDRLRKQVAAFTASYRGAGADPAIGTRGQTAGDALDLLANLFSESDEAAGVLAETLDRSRNAGLTCERQYDSLVPVGQRASAFMQ